MVENSHSFNDDSSLASSTKATKAKEKVASSSPGKFAEAGTVEKTKKTTMADAEKPRPLPQSMAVLSLSQTVYEVQAYHGAQATRYSSRFDDATEASVESPGDGTTSSLSATGSGHAHPAAARRCCWSDEQTEQILMDTLIKSDNPQNVLEYRRQWPEAPMPDTRQLNRVLYKLRDEGKIVQCPPNGTNQKPCWTHYERV